MEPKTLEELANAYRKAQEVERDAGNALGEANKAVDAASLAFRKAMEATRSARHDLVSYAGLPEAEDPEDGS